jgi:hypothetical protein
MLRDREIARRPISLAVRNSDHHTAPPHFFREGTVCFSAGGSFALSGVLVGAGAVSSARSTPAARLLAVVPLLFAAQQAAEGIIWLTVDVPTHATLERAAVYAFLGSALVLWPTLAPLALRLMEPRRARHRALTKLLAMGAIVSLVAAILLVRAEPTARITDHSITYEFGGGAGTLRQLLLFAFYVVPTVVPFFVSTARWASVIGGSLVVSVTIAALIRHEALTSVWCFFAAIVSVIVVFAVGSPRLARPERGR